MNPLALFSKREELLALDIGSGAIKMVELAGTVGQPSIKSFAVRQMEEEIFSNNGISKPELVSEALVALCEANEIEGKRVVVGIPAPAVFTKRIKMPKQSPEELRNSVQFEAGNFIPHKIEAVKLDFAILGESGKNQLDVMVVAVKNELLDSMEDCLALAGLEAAIADVDFFALHNAFESNYPELREETVAVLSIGYRYTSLCISRGGLPLFVGDVAIGAKQLEEELTLKLSLPEHQVRKAVRNFNFEADWQATVSGFVDQSAQELSRQLSFFWNTCGVEGNLNKVFLTGAGALLPGFTESLGRKSGFACDVLNPLQKVAIGEGVDKEYLAKVSPLLAVALGLGLRSPGDGAA